jgi:hypothetical protein
MKRVESPLIGTCALSFIAGAMVIGALPVLSAVRSLNEFDSDNDPHGEHDFGIIKNRWRAVLSQNRLLRT